ncbi:protein-L-isoaspartate(D-aspartate) O-methyltransferase [Imbroritus primus]|uniref:Protein-L-isoaspartate(D-aspartate) O-methyltransferase n=1 Tax=Imbroritus primus TaxID=3058603 RepID=A0ACD3SMQ3_9BURK|nr:protein-L-isoaspartate(D-aspartate) O-methyltransferase [Burkholderiaceae bacterium PBA]
MTAAKRKFPLPLDAVVTPRPKTVEKPRVSAGVHATGSRPAAATATPARPASPARTPVARAPAPVRPPAPESAVNQQTRNASVAGGGMASDRARQALVGRLRKSQIRDELVLAAVGTVPRHLFIDGGLASQAYEDAALPIGHQQTISKPSVVARMIELLRQGRMSGSRLGKVLEIGTGCGYQAAVLSLVADEVYSIERIRPLHEKAKSNLRPLRLPNVRLHYGDGMVGLPQAAPFDAIILAAAGMEIPQALLDQLSVGGRLIAPVVAAGGGDSGRDGGVRQQLLLIERRSRYQFHRTALEAVFFVPLKSGIV